MPGDDVISKVFSEESSPERTPTHGDSEMRGKTAELERRVREWNLLLSSNRIRQRYDGKAGELEEFLDQWALRELVVRWVEQCALAEVRRYLEGNALRWFKGANGRTFEFWAEFKKEIRECFEDEGEAESHQQTAELRGG